MRNKHQRKSVCPKKEKRKNRKKGFGGGNSWGRDAAAEKKGK